MPTSIIHALLLYQWKSSTSYDSNLFTLFESIATLFFKLSVLFSNCSRVGIDVVINVMFVVDWFADILLLMLA